MESNIPIRGINKGTLGYLTTVEVDAIEKCLEELIQGNYEIDERMRLFASFEQKGVTQEDNALNEICLTRAGSLKILSFHIYINGEFLYTDAGLSAFIKFKKYCDFRSGPDHNRTS